MGGLIVNCLCLIFSFSSIVKTLLNIVLLSVILKNVLEITLLISTFLYQSSQQSIPKVKYPQNWMTLEILLCFVVPGLPQDMRAPLSCSYPLGFNNIFLHESNLYFGTLLSNVFKVSCNIKGTSTKASAVQMATCLNTFDITFIS